MDACRLSRGDGRARASPSPAGAEGGRDAVRRARRLGAQRGGSRPAARSRTCSTRLSRRSSRSWSPRTGRPTSPTGRRARSRTGASRASSRVPARGEGRGTASLGSRDVERGPCVHGREHRVEQDALRSSSATSRTRRSVTSAGSSRSRARTARTWRASTGATRRGCASRSPRAARSPRATGRSTRFGARPMSRTIRSTATISDSRTSWSRAVGGRSTSRRPSRSRSRRASPRTSTGGRCARSPARSGHILTGRMFRPTRPLYLFELVSHRVLRYSTGLLHLGLLASNLALLGAGVSAIACFLALQLGGLGLAAAGRARLPIPGARLAYYYYVVTKATVAGAGPLSALRHASDLGQGEGNAMNRAADVAIAGAGLVLASPLLAAAALAIKLESGGPVLYRQTRVGQGGRGLRCVQAPDDGRRRREPRRRDSPSTTAIRASRESGAFSAGHRSTSCLSSGTSFEAT